MSKLTGRIHAHIGATLDDGRPEGDFYATPSEAVDRLFKNWRPFFKTIFEPACGDGAISKNLEGRGYKVKSHDLFDRGFGEPGHDFLACSTPWPATIMTNPPFSLAEKFAERALELTRGKGEVIFLCRLAWLEGQKRQRLFTQYPLHKVFVFSGRIPMMHRPGYAGKKSSPMLAYAWYWWDWSYSGPPQLDWI